MHWACTKAACGKEGFLGLKKRCSVDKVDRLRQVDWGCEVKVGEGSEELATLLLRQQRLGFRKSSLLQRLHILSESKGPYLPHSLSKSDHATCRAWRLPLTATGTWRIPLGFSSSFLPSWRV